jgi:hypothetical protein
MSAVRDGQPSPIPFEEIEQVTRVTRCLADQREYSV